MALLQPCRLDVDNVSQKGEPCQHRVESKSTTLRQHHADTKEEPCLTPTPTTGPCATSPTTGASPTTPSAPTEPVDAGNSPNRTPCSAALPPGGRRPSFASSGPARAPAPICERTPPVSDSIVEFLRERFDQDEHHARTRGEMAVLYHRCRPRASAGGGAPEGGDRPGGR